MSSENLNLNLSIALHDDEIKHKMDLETKALNFLSFIAVFFGIIITALTFALPIFKTIQFVIVPFILLLIGISLLIISMIYLLKVLELKPYPNLPEIIDVTKLQNLFDSPNKLKTNFLNSYLGNIVSLYQYNKKKSEKLKKASLFLFAGIIFFILFIIYILIISLLPVKL